jgi:hypothetical protein
MSSTIRSRHLIRGAFVAAAAALTFSAFAVAPGAPSAGASSSSAGFASTPLTTESVPVSARINCVGCVYYGTYAPGPTAYDDCVAYGRDGERRALWREFSCDRQPDRSVILRVKWNA